MRLPSQPTTAIVDHLNTTYFHRVWNAPDDHGRANFDLQKAARRLQIGAVPVDLSLVGLPTSDTVYAVYRTSVSVFGRFVTFFDGIWVSDRDLLNRFGVNITTYTTDGRVMGFGEVQFKFDAIKATVYIAVPHRITSVCAQESYPVLHATIDKDTSRKTPVVIDCWKISKNATGLGSLTDINQRITNIKTTNPTNTTVYVNGWAYVFDKIPTIKVGDVVQIETDPDIIGYVDVQVDDDLGGYFSIKYGQYREVLHIPKALNPDNVVITNDTPKLLIFDAVTKKGVYGHRLDPHALESITHNDFSMGRPALEAFQAGLGAGGIFVRLFVRYATDPQPVGREVNALLDLYTLSDDEIKRQLVGTSTKQIIEWKASYLEQSEYIDLLYKFDGFVNTVALKEYSDAMGYHDVASTLAQSLVRYTYQGSEVIISKPMRLLGQPCEVLVYVNGRKVPANLVSLSACCTHSFALSFKQAGYVPIGTEIVVYIVEGGIRDVVAFTPTSTNPSITVEHEDYLLFKKVDYLTDQPVWQDVTRSGFVPVAISPGDYRTKVNADGTVTFTANATRYTQRLYMVPQPALVTTVYPLNSYLSQDEPVVIPLRMAGLTNEIIPLIGYSSLEVYLNGYRLIEDVDYQCIQQLGDNGDILQTLLTVSGSHYFDLTSTTNTIETVVHGGKILSKDTGYVINNMLYRETPPMLWSKTCGRAFINGELVLDVTDLGNILVTDTPVDNGLLYHTEWTLPYSVAKLMATIPADRDADFRVRVGRLLGMLDPDYPEHVSVYLLHALYSPYLAKIVADVSKGLFTIHDDPNLETFLKQFAPYRLLYRADPVLNTNNYDIDRRFVTIAAHYVNLAVADPLQMMLVQKLSGLLLTPSDLAIKEVLL